MKRRSLSLLLAGVLSLSMILPVQAASPVAVSEAAQVVQALGIMMGDTGGNMNLSRAVTRAEFITMVVKATPGGDQIGQAATSPYPDVSFRHWASGYVEAGVSNGLIRGYSDGYFRPERQIALAEGVSIVLQLLGYTAADFSGAYPTGQMALYRSLNLNQGVTVTGNSDPMTRQDAMYLFYNLMSTQRKDGTYYLNAMGYSLNAAHEIDLVALINATMDGPLVATGSWQASLPFSPASGQVYRNGTAASLAAVQPMDVVYWNQYMRTLWVYSERLTGSIQALSPSASSPASVTVAGRACTIGTAAAAYALSDLGSYRLGDTVTLLLGRNGEVAAVTAPSADTSGQRLGVVTAVGSAAYSDGSGGSYQANTVTLLASDGQSYSYQSKTTAPRVGAVVEATTSPLGEVSLRTLSTQSLTGRVNSTGTAVGSNAFADDIQILDVSDGFGVRVYPGRLAGIDLGSGKVRYYSLDSQGKINRLVLNDVTGDMYHYGILTKLGKPSTEAPYYSYVYDLAGTPGQIPQTTTGYPVSEGPVYVKGNPSAFERMFSLTSAGAGEVSGNQFKSGNKSYTLSDNVLVYERRSGDYFLSTLSRVSDGSFTLTGWYDKAESSGGRIRVIVAQEID